MLRDTWSDALSARFWNFLQVAPVEAWPALHTVTTVHSDRPIDARALERALADVTAWYPALVRRPTMPEAVSGEQSPTLREIVVADDTEVVAALDTHAATPLDPTTGPLLSTLLLTLREHGILQLVTHQLVCDPNSVVTVVEKLAERYEAYLPDRVPPYPMTSLPQTPPVPTCDDSLIAGLYDEIRNVPLDIALPGMRPRKATPEYGCAVHHLDLHREVVDQVRACAARLGVPTETIHLAGFRALLHRCAGEDAVLVMTELDRRVPEAGPGCWTDLVPLVLTGARRLRFSDLVATSSRQLDEARRRSPVAIPELAHRFQQELASAGSTLGRVGFAVRPADCLLPVAGGTWTRRIADPRVSQFDLSLVLREGAAGCSASFVYDPDLLPEWAVSTLAHSFVQVLRSATATPESRITDLVMIDPYDRRILLEEWNGPKDLVPVTGPVPSLFESHAAERPDTPAVVDQGVTHTYSGVNSLANRVAHALLASGVRKGDVVGLYISRSVEWIVAYLAAYKIGAVVVGLDPGAPRSRIEAAIAASPPVAVITPSSATEATALRGLEVIRVDVHSDAVRKQPSENPGIPVGLDDPAYIVQTSGSTGRPRAVFGVHRAHAHLSLQVAAVMGVGPGSRASWLVDAAAGISISLVWRALCAGATLCIPGDEELVSAVRLRDWHLRNGLTHTFVTTQLAEPLTALEWPPDSPLQVMEVGGEKVRRWPSAELPFEVVVAYGSNEAFLVTSMLFPWEQRMTARTATADDRRLPPPVGRPLPGVHVYVVDPDLRLLPPGVVGAVCVDSPELMLGYLGEPGETARRLRPNPYGPPGSRLLWTGDVGSMRPDGLLELTGRLDDMVKVRGFRVEPAAVEAILLDHPAVTNAAVVAVADAAGHNQLVACVVADRPVTPEQLRAYMIDHAPGYMVPIAYVPMESLPRGLLNKVDRKQLPPENWRAYRPRVAYREPTGEAETALCRIFAEVLEEESFGADDNLIDMGASSLHVGRVQVRILEQLGVELSIRQIFEAPTPAALATTVRQNTTPRRRALPPVLPRSTR